MIFYTCGKVFSYRFDPWEIFGYCGLWGHFDNSKHKFCTRIYISREDMDKYEKFIQKNPIECSYIYRLELEPNTGHTEWKILDIYVHEGRLCSIGSS